MKYKSNLLCLDNDSRKREAFSVGPVLYSPATNQKIFEKLRNNNWIPPYSLALCLEDSIADSAVALGEETIRSTIQKLYLNADVIPYLPKLFIRVRDARQIPQLFYSLGPSATILSGFILPKFCEHNAEQYFSAFDRIREDADHPLYLMPILESADLVPLETRLHTLLSIKQLLLPYKDVILNLRVGGNDLCNTFGLRRNVTETIYDIRPISNLLSDIITVYHSDFVISGPVWEYFEDKDSLWKEGLLREVQMDLLNGFIGKTAIHPNQINVIHQAMSVRKQDLEDTKRILSYEDSIVAVQKSAAGTRMNERKTHTKWAQTQLLLSQIYGVRE